MKYSRLNVILGLVVWAMLLAAPAFALRMADNTETTLPPDDFVGDTSIYTLQASAVPVNVLFVIDNSASAAQAARGEGYDGYNSSSPYPKPAGGFETEAIYEADNKGVYSKILVSSMTELTCGINPDFLTQFKADIQANGTFTVNGSLESPTLPKGECKTAPSGASYALGDFLNYLLAPAPDPVIVSVGSSYYAPILTHFSNYWISHPTLGFLGGTFWTQVSAPSDTSGIPAWAPGQIYEAAGSSQIEVIANAIRITVGGASTANIHFGAMEYGANNKGGQILYPITDLSDETKMAEFLAAIPSDPDTDLLTSNTSRPAVGTLRDALAYYRGEATFPIISKTNPYPSPISLSCQPNYIVYIANGMNNETLGTSDLTWFENMRITKADGTEVGAPCGDVDGDGAEESGGTCDASYGLAGYHYLDDIAKYMNEVDQIDDSIMEDAQTIKTATVLAFQESEPLVERAGDFEHGGGRREGEDPYKANSAQELASALQDIILNIVRDANASFVAPVVPASPENRVRSGRRIYLGFFRPIEQEAWHGNLKKYIITEEGDINALADPDAATEVPFDTSGSFELWNTLKYPDPTDPDYPNGAQIYVPDEGQVDQGGVGAKLRARADDETRTIFTFMGDDFDLTAAANAIDTANTGNNGAGLSLEDYLELGDPTDFERIIHRVHGRNLVGGTPEVREWVLGDILHSKPNIFNYNIFEFNVSTEEAAPPTSAGLPYGDWANDCPGGDDCNKTVIYVGANDGMLHAFADASGEELWGYVPPNLLPSLKDLENKAHNYYVDGSPIIYARDQNDDGNYKASSDKLVGDRVTVVFGTRRGGGTSSLDPGVPRGAYHALDVSDPTRPKFQFAFDSNDVLRYNEANDSVETFPSGMGELGETFSTPVIRRLKISNGSGGTIPIIAMFIGAGYDNNEDLRWGSTDNYPLDPAVPGIGGFDITDQTVEYSLKTSHTAGSAATGYSIYDDPARGVGCGLTGGSCAPVNQRGRGIYIVEIARAVKDTGTGTEYRDYSHAGEKVWGFTFGASDATDTTAKTTTLTQMTHSIPADLRVLDLDDDLYADRIYVADTGGKLWRFDIGDVDPSNWSAKLIFTANANAADSTTGRKFFYNVDHNQLSSKEVDLFLGSGDRVHPLNYLNAGDTDGAVLDRLYMIKDLEPVPSLSFTPESPIDESHLVDLTDNPLQDAAVSQGTKDALTAELENAPYDATPGKYGWMINLDAAPGEKALSPPQEILGLLLQTTYSPNVDITDPCLAGNPGISRFYAMKALTGEAFLDLNGDDDTTAEDREVVVGSGIPPEPTIIVTTKGVQAIIVSESEGSKDSVAKTQLTNIGIGEVENVVPVYWMQW